MTSWLRRHDPGLSALRRAARAAIVVPLLFLLGSRVIGNPEVALRRTDDDTRLLHNRLGHGRDADRFRKAGGQRVEPRRARRERAIACFAGAERELGLIESALIPIARRKDASSRAKAQELAREIAGQLEVVRSSLIRSALGRL